MRRLFSHITIFLLFVLFLFCFLAMFTNNMARAAPFLICDPQTNVTHYVVTINEITETVAAYDLGDGTVMLAYDLKDVDTGLNTCLVKAKNEWGESVNVPFSFTRAPPDAPVNVRKEQKIEG